MGLGLSKWERVRFRYRQRKEYYHGGELDAAVPVLKLIHGQYLVVGAFDGNRAGIEVRFGACGVTT